MNWSRVPIVSMAISIAAGIWTALYAVFVKFPLFMAGYKQCSMCYESISPKAEMKTATHNYHGHECINHYCASCSSKLFD